jgi:hypothetical protein
VPCSVPALVTAINTANNAPGDDTINLAGGCTYTLVTPDNVRLAHRLCNQRDYIWRMKINALLGKRMSLEEIAEKMNLENVRTIHGTNRWTAASVRKAFVS